MDFSWGWVLEHMFRIFCGARFVSVHQISSTLKNIGLRTQALMADSRHPAQRMLICTCLGNVPF